MKAIKIIGIIALVIIVIFLVGRTILNKVITSETEISRQSKHNEEVISIIDKQLDGINIENLLKKKNLILEKTVYELQNHIKSGELTYEELTAFYLYRIKQFDQNSEGLNSVVTVNPKAIELARKCDENPNSNTSLLYGIPVALKDNINTKDMATTAGSPALAGFVPDEDADIVIKLKEDGAIILAKANLSEFANFKSYTMPNGYNDYKGQNLNPYGPLKITTWGSSSGSGTCASSNFAAVTIGTETTGSIVAPASVQGVVGYRPSLGKVSGQGIIPLSHSLDTAGPITRTVYDAAVLYKSISNDDSVDLEKLDENYLSGKNIGIVELYKDLPDTKKLIESLEQAGANIVFIKYDGSKLDNFDILIAEFRDDLNDYLIKYNAPFNSLKDIIAFYEDDKENRAKYGYDLLSLAEKSNNLSSDEIESRMKEATLLMHSIFDTYKIDALASTDNSQALLACMSASPEITVPLYIDASNTPHGATFSTRPGDDFEALKISYSFEQKTKGRIPPIIE